MDSTTKAFSTLVWNGMTIQARRSDGFVNATELCRAGGKRFRDWYKTATAQELIEELSEQLQCKTTIVPLLPPEIVEVNRGNSSGKCRGSWVHPDLAVHVAMWVCKKFAFQVSRWVREIMTTGSATAESKTHEQLLALQEENKKYKEENFQKTLLLKEKDEQLNRLHILHIDLLSYKKNILKQESIYIVSSENYARQGIYKVGRTAQSMANRSSQHNNTHVGGDKIKVLKEFKVSNSVTLERSIHAKLRGLVMHGEKEFLKIPFKLLSSIVQLMVDHDCEDSEAVNCIIDEVYRLRTLPFNSQVWMDGIPEHVFSQSPAKIKTKQGNLSPEEKKQIVLECIAIYLQRNADAAQSALVLWSALQRLLIEHLQISRKDFRSKDWREVAKEAAGEQLLRLAIRTPLLPIAA